jgi:hypothetical protein
MIWSELIVYYIVKLSFVEACTQMNTQNIRSAGTLCSYWIDGRGNIFYGRKHLLSAWKLIPLLSKLGCHLSGVLMDCV